LLKLGKATPIFGVAVLQFSGKPSLTLAAAAPSPAAASVSEADEHAPSNNALEAIINATFL
jgi:hypothetical protein